MSKRFAIKIAGASGQGVNVLGEILARALKRSGFYVFAYREYPSLIKGGHATYQIDISDQYISGSTIKIDILMVLNRQATNWHLDELVENGVIFHDIDNPRISKDEFAIIQQKNIKMIYVPAISLSKASGGNEVTSNIVSLGAIWKSLNLHAENLFKVIEWAFADKPKFIPIDISCAQSGYDYSTFQMPPYTKRIIKENEISNFEKTAVHLTNLSTQIFNIQNSDKLGEHLLISGNEALGIGAIDAGVRIYFSYPMTPTSSLLTYLAEQQEQSGMVVKQVEDEITASAMAIGAMYAGTRALTATSGGGFDLMTEHLSLAAITEIPFVVIIGQRPGPATGMPSWTTQGDLMLSIFAGHGEFSRCVMAIKDSEDAFYTIQMAMNIAEKYQIPVILLTEKHIAESIYMVDKFDSNKITIQRGLVTDRVELEQLTSKDRYAITENGISKRWLPGSASADFDTNSDEHTPEGNVTEEADMASEMIAKRLRKEKTLLAEIEDPVVYSNKPAREEKIINIIGWGSTYGVINDIFPYFEAKNIKVNYMHVKYLWPLRADAIRSFVTDVNTILIEGNHNAQLGQLIKMETGIDIKNKLLKWNGRPFFVEEVINYIESQVAGL